MQSSSNDQKKKRNRSREDYDSEFPDWLNKVNYLGWLKHIADCRFVSAAVGLRRKKTGKAITLGDETVINSRVKKDT